MIASVTDNQELENLVLKQTELYQEMMPQFWYADNSWCYYMLNERTPNSPHYLIFEIRLFQALADATGIDFYAQEAQLRMNAMKSTYQLYLLDSGEETQYVFLRGGMPHYYYSDIYATELVFFASDGSVLKRDRLDGRERDAAWMVGSYPDETARVEWHIKPEALWSLNMGDLNIIQLDTSEAMVPEALDFSYTADLDGSLDGDSLSIRPDRSEELRGELIGTLEKSLPVSPYDIFAFELENTSNETLVANIVFYDSERFGMGRYVQSLMPGKNLVAVALPGFSQYGLEGLQDLSFFNLRIYTIETQMEEHSVEIGNFYQLHNQLQLYNLTENSEYRIKWGEG